MDFFKFCFKQRANYIAIKTKHSKQNLKKFHLRSTIINFLITNKKSQMTAIENMNLKFDSSPLSRSLSITELQKYLFNSKKKTEVEKKEENKSSHLSMKLDEKSINEFAIKDPNVFSGSNEVRFMYHNNEMVFFVGPQINAKNETLMNYVNMYHQALESCPKVTYERYGWQPDFAQRVKIDLSARLLGFVVADNHIKTNDDQNGATTGTVIKAQITLFPCAEQNAANMTAKKSSLENGKQTITEKREIALVVFPLFQRQHLATDLVRITWNVFKFTANEEWIYVMNSNKSAMFWRSLKQWYPDINFKLVRH
ncbi:hypothetical protein RFI_06097 [Reticulomyxa filosa]|uniref:Uncharacterized protein n=1 Tax=Reticulomyxa filosa TaxID=46433 RepID=X6NYV9_RETFI|nr:hypothetical protein RFI_06097 [Reticulomyxa filosa]|eukprot:ETO31024.1 hypothetical protein RFI_06097 [Reticulomyxa filosa]